MGRIKNFSNCLLWEVFTLIIYKLMGKIYIDTQVKNK